MFTFGIKLHYGLPANKLIEYLIGHYKYTQMEHIPLFLEKNYNYRTKKTNSG